jgi:hypothetical protein
MPRKSISFRNNASSRTRPNRAQVHSFCSRAWHWPLPPNGPCTTIPWIRPTAHSCNPSEILVKSEPNPGQCGKDRERSVGEGAGHGSTSKKSPFLLKPLPFCTQRNSRNDDASVADGTPKKGGRVPGGCKRGPSLPRPCGNTSRNTRCRTTQEELGREAEATLAAAPPPLA